jgi:hypothetical protein
MHDDNVIQYEPPVIPEPIKICEGEGDLGAVDLFTIELHGDLFKHYAISRRQFADAVVTALRSIITLRPGYYLYHYETEEP